jgi:hypothetical protein
MTKFPVTPYSSDCNKNEIKNTNVKARNKIKVSADDALRVENRYLLGSTA